MKKLVTTILMVLSCGASYALPVGNPSEASLFINGAWWDGYWCDPCDPCFSWCDAWSLRIGYYGDFVFNRHLEIRNDDAEGGDIDHTQISTNAGYLALNICDRVDIFGTLGATRLKILSDGRSWGYPFSVLTELNFETEFSWSVGGRATLWNCNCFTLGLEGQYFQTSTNFDNFIRYDLASITYFNDNNDVRYSEWQVGLGLSYRFATSCPTFAMIPYTAIKWSDSRLNFGNFSFFDPIITDPSFPNLKAKKHWGYAVGMSLTLCDMIGVTAEGRWGDEKAFYINGQFRF